MRWALRIDTALRAIRHAITTARTERPMRHAFTLIEIVIVISIIAILASLLMPAISMIRTQAKIIHCSNNLRQITMASLVYSQQNRNRLIPTKYIAADGVGQHWHFRLADILEESETIDNPSIQRRVLRGCPSWPNSEGWNTLRFGQGSWNTGYAQTMFVADPNSPEFPGPGNLNADYLTGKFPAITATLSSVTLQGSRPFYADNADFWLWTPWQADAWDSDGQDGLRIRSIEIHKKRANTSFFDGHLERQTHAELVTAQETW